MSNIFDSMEILNTKSPGDTPITDLLPVSRRHVDDSDLLVLEEYGNKLSATEVYITRCGHSSWYKRTRMLVDKSNWKHVRGFPLDSYRMDGDPRMLLAFNASDPNAWMITQAQATSRDYSDRYTITEPLYQSDLAPAWTADAAFDYVVRLPSALNDERGHILSSGTPEAFHQYVLTVRLLNAMMTICSASLNEAMEDHITDLKEMFPELPLPIMAHGFRGVLTPMYTQSDLMEVLARGIENMPGYMRNEDYIRQSRRKVIEQEDQYVSVVPATWSVPDSAAFPGEQSYGLSSQNISRFNTWRGYASSYQRLVGYIPELEEPLPDLNECLPMLAEAMHKVADHNNMCEIFDETMESIGFPGRERRTYAVRVIANVTLRDDEVFGHTVHDDLEIDSVEITGTVGVCITVQARSAEDASSEVGLADVDDKVEDLLATEWRDVTVDSYEIEDVEIAD